LLVGADGLEPPTYAL